MEHGRIAPRARLSHVFGANDDPLSWSTIAKLLKDTASKWPGRTAVVFRSQQIRSTWRELAEQVDILASGLLELGIQRGDRVALWSPNRYECLLTQFATARIGAILVSLNPAYVAGELEYALNKAGCKALILPPQFRSTKILTDIAPELADATPGALNSARLADLRIVIHMGNDTVPGMILFRDVMKLGGTRLDTRELESGEAELNADDAINIQFTSGTTGRPRGATLSHFNIVNNARYAASCMRLTHNDSLCVTMPLYHCIGMVLSSLACVSVGASMVFPAEAFDPETTLAAISEERCTALHGVPTMFIAELEHPNFSRYDLRTLRTGLMAGSPCPIEVMRRVIDQMNLAQITIAYGMTETSPVSFQSETGDPIEKRTTTVGRIHPHIEVKIVDEHGNTVPVGVAGELCTRGYSVMKGYWGDKDATALAIRDGWMHSGDLAVLDEHGYCNIVGRLKDMLIRGGENIFPREIEEILFTHSKVMSVQVFGIPDQKYGEQVCAWIIPRPRVHITQEEIIEFCQGRMASYKVPRVVRFVQDMPMTASGKPQKYLMRKQMMEELDVADVRTA
nr:AMP-binding protein [Paraburkholderia humisilvae]